MDEPKAEVQHKYYGTFWPYLCVLHIPIFLPYQKKTVVSTVYDSPSAISILI